MRPPITRMPYMNTSLSPKLIQIKGHTLAAYCYNPEAVGKPVILIHGITSSIRFWDQHILPEYLKQGPCYSLSLPGHYPAVAPANFKRDTISARHLADIMMEGINALVGITPVTLIGHSTGGFMAVNLAAHFPQQILRTISISGFVSGQWTGTLGTLQKAVRSGWLGKHLFINAYRLLRSTPQTFDRFLGFYPSEISAEAKKAILGTTYKDFKDLDLKCMAEYFAAMPDIDITALLPRVTSPTLAIAGIMDEYVPSEQMRFIESGIQNSTSVYIQNANHLPFIDQPVEFQRIIAEWLQSHP